MSVAIGVAEEVFWRGVVWGQLVPLGLPIAFALTTLGFAATHVPSQGRRGGVFHLATGAAFGAIFVRTGSVAAAAASHATYNAVVAALKGVDKHLGRVEALRGVDLEVRRGEIVALLGPNGAGKTTLVSVLLGLRRPDRGTAYVAGIAGATPQAISFPPTIRVGEIMAFARAHYDSPRSTANLVARFGLEGLERRQAGGLSGGQARRLAIALAFAGSPDLVVLDEPTVGLDVESRRAVWNEVREFADEGGSVLVTTHMLEEAREHADRVVVLVRGTIVAEGSPAELADEERFLELLRDRS